MASPDRSKRKILKAKKTMPASCRKQAEILNKSKNVEALQTATRNNNMSSGNQNSNTSIISSKYEQSENAASLLDSNKNSVCSLKSNVLSQNVTKPLETVDSETRSEYVEDQVVCPSQKPSKTIESSRKLLTQETKDSQNTSKNHFECQTDVTRSCFEQREEDCNLKSSLLSGMVQLSKSTVNNTLEDKIINKIGSHLATDSNSELCDKRQGDILSSDISFVLFDKIPELMNSVISNSCPADILKGENSSRSCHSSISDCENVDSIWLSALDVHRNNCHNLKKRMFSENQGNVKRMKTSEQINENICVALERQTAFLEQVKLLIRQEIYSINYKLFDNKLKELTERIGETQCRNKHEAVAHELFVKISKLQRRIRVVLQSQKNCLEPNVLTSNTAHKVTSSETKLDKNPESISSPKERKTSVSSEPSGPSENAREKINLSTEHNAVSGRHYNLSEESRPPSWRRRGSTETLVRTSTQSICFKELHNNDDVMLISLESPILTAPITSNPTGTGKTKSESSNGSSDAETEVKAVEKKFDSVIDLTEEAPSKRSTERSASTFISPTKVVSTSKETRPVAQNAAQAPEPCEHLPPLPEPPAMLPELAEKTRDTLPPQKPELRVKRVLRPRGIALTWNITKINPKCAPVESYHLFLCHENPTHKLVWKKIGEIKALPLPMACTLSQFLASNKYYFTVQSKDIFGRYGPFCDIKCIPGFSEDLT